MPFYYSIVPGSDQTSATGANSNTDHLRCAVAAGSEVMINSLYIWGRANAASTISSISYKLLRMSSASTTGTAFTPQPRDTNSPAALSSWFTAPTIGTSATQADIEIGCLSAGAAYWMPYDPDAAVRLKPGGSGTAGNIDGISQGSAASLAFRYSLEFYER